MLLLDKRPGVVLKVNHDKKNLVIIKTSFTVGLIRITCHLSQNFSTKGYFFSFLFHWKKYKIIMWLLLQSAQNKHVSTCLCGKWLVGQGAIYSLIYSSHLWHTALSSKNCSFCDLRCWLSVRTEFTVLGLAIKWGTAHFKHLSPPLPPSTVVDLPSLWKTTTTSRLTCRFRLCNKGYLLIFLKLATSLHENVPPKQFSDHYLRQNTVAACFA